MRILAAVLEFLANPTADLEAIRRRHREIAAVEEGVKIRPQKKSVRDGMRAARGVRHDMGGLEHGKRPLARQGAPSFVRAPSPTVRSWVRPATMFGRPVGRSLIHSASGKNVVSVMRRQPIV